MDAKLLHTWGIFLYVPQVRCGLCVAMNLSRADLTAAGEKTRASSSEELDAKCSF